MSTAIEPRCWFCNRTGPDMILPNERWAHTECAPHETPQKYIAHLERQLAEARARVEALEKVVVIIRGAMCSLQNGRYDLVREYEQAIGDALAALPEPPEDVT